MGSKKERAWVRVGTLGRDKNNRRDSEKGKRARCQKTNAPEESGFRFVRLKCHLQGVHSAKSAP